MVSLAKDWITITFLRLVHALGWPVWALVLIGLVVVPVAYLWWLKQALEASE